MSVRTTVKQTYTSNASVMSFPVPSKFKMDEHGFLLNDIDKTSFAGVMLSRFLPKMENKSYLPSFENTLRDIGRNDKLKKFFMEAQRSGNDKKELKEIATEIFGDFSLSSSKSDGEKDAIFYAVNLVEKMVFANSLKNERASKVWSKIETILVEQRSQFQEKILDQLLDSKNPTRYNFSGKMHALKSDVNGYLKLRACPSKIESGRDLNIPKFLKEILEKIDLEPYQKAWVVGEFNRRLVEFSNMDIPRNSKMEVEPFDSRNIVDIDALLKEAKNIPGWRKALMTLPNDIAWALDRYPNQHSIKDVVLNHKMYGLPPFWKEVSPFQGFQKGAYEKICEEFKIYPWAKAKKLSHQLLSAFNLTKVFGRNHVAAIQFVKDYSDIIKKANGLDIKNKKYTAMDIHSAAVNIKLPPEGSKWDKEKWVALIMKHPEMMKYISSFPEIEAHLGRVPKGLVEAREIKNILGYGEVDPKYYNVARECARVEVTPHVFNSMLSHFDDAKKEAWLPDVTTESSEYKVKLLAPGDWRALIAGEYSGCCQKIGAAGSSCALNSYKEPSSGVYWIEDPKDGKCLAQTWSWLDKERKTIVFDSVESTFHAIEMKEKVKKAIQDLAQKLSQEGYTVLIGKTNYGMTGDLTSMMALTESVRTPEMYTYTGYSDSRSGTYKIADGMNIEAKMRAESFSEIFRQHENAVEGEEMEVLPLELPDDIYDYMENLSKRFISSGNVRQDQMHEFFFMHGIGKETVDMFIDRNERNVSIPSIHIENSREEVLNYATERSSEFVEFLKSKGFELESYYDNDCEQRMYALHVPDNAAELGIEETEYFDEIPLTNEAVVNIAMQMVPDLVRGFVTECRSHSNNLDESFSIAA